MIKDAPDTSIFTHDTSRKRPKVPFYVFSADKLLARLFCDLLP
jgi:hypothetical protein